MRRAVGILAIFAVPALAVTAALAADPYGSEAGTYQHRGTTSGIAGTAGRFMGEHTMTGRVTDIDKDKGRVSVSAEGETLDLHFPKSAIQNLNKGDQVTVSLGIRPAMGGATHGGTSGTPGTRGMPGAGTGAGMPGSRGTESGY